MYVQIEAARVKMVGSIMQTHLGPKKMMEKVKQIQN